ncbi:MAG: Cytochrome C biogenesis protein transmembrane region [Alphaproteobacteria bacterium ADurb.Bin438]|nr:MAG: Cytochrome C biogenesis protein transmembrane region [Alphaproteobacteria bacterium ADurb.Bin438]
MPILITSIWLGILTSISPCPLTSNIAAISYLGNKNNSFNILVSGIFYTFGRIVSYLILGIIFSLSFNYIPFLSRFLQNYSPYFVAPILIFIGFIMLDLVKINFKKQYSLVKDENKEKIANQGFLGAFLLGALFALALCPISAGLFIGNLIETKGNFLSILFYGLGTGIPVIFVSFLLGFGMKHLAFAFNKITKFETIARKTTGLVFIGGGIYYIYSILINLK